MLTRDKCQTVPFLLYLKPLMLVSRYISFSLKNNKPQSFDFIGWIPYSARVPFIRFDFHS